MICICPVYIYNAHLQVLDLKIFMDFRRLRFAVHDYIRFIPGTRVVPSAARVTGQRCPYSQVLLQTPCSTLTSVPDLDGRAVAAGFVSSASQAVSER